MSSLHLYGCILNGYFKCIGFIGAFILITCSIKNSFDKILTMSIKSIWNELVIDSEREISIL